MECDVRHAITSRPEARWTVLGTMAGMGEDTERIEKLSRRIASAKEYL
jgi:hypothetical protein